MKAIAKDVVWHFNNRGYKGKAMFIAMDKVVAVRMYNFITEEWKLYVDKREKEIEKIDDLQEQLVQRKLWSWTKETEVAVVISSEQNEVDKFLDWGLDIEPHREKMNTRDLEKDFKGEDHPFRFAIVCAMWITGFDVPDLSTMYVDKPLKTHTLMQAIARANRVHEEKNNGLIVDYIETYKALLEALAIYAVGSTKLKDENKPEPPVQPLDDLIHDLSEVTQLLEDFLAGELNFTLETIINNKGALRIAAIKNGIDAVYTNDESKNKFGVMAREVFKKYKALDPDKSIYAFKPKRDAIDAIYRAIMNQIHGADITSIIREVQDIVNESVIVWMCLSTLVKITANK